MWVPILTPIHQGEMITMKPFPETQQTASTHTDILIEVEHLTRVITTRTRKTTILDDVTFSIRAGSLFTISGPSGSGKSTLLTLLTGIERPDSGRVLFTGEELRARSENALARWRGSMSASFSSSSN
jgi:ABC-type lipoprotein export system ATPase subunit